MPLLDLIPQPFIDDPQRRGLLDGPVGFSIEARLTFAGHRILHEALPVPHETSGVELIIEDASAASPIAVDGRHAPWLAPRSWNAVFVQFDAIALGLDPAANMVKVRRTKTTCLQEMYDMSRLAFLAILASVGSAAAQDGPSFDCGKAESSAEQVVCADADLAALDRLVADRYTAAVEVVQGLDAGAEEAEHELRAYQRGWVEGRDECWKSDDLRDCVEAEYLRREGQLVAQYLLQEPISVVAWQCGGNPANEVVTYFFDTRLPSVRIERGDTIDTGSLVPTATGSKYEASFGRSIWIKGEEAIYREADPDGSEVDCAS